MIIKKNVLNGTLLKIISNLQTKNRLILSPIKQVKEVLNMRIGQIIVTQIMFLRIKVLKVLSSQITSSKMKITQIEIRVSLNLVIPKLISV